MTKQFSYLCCAVVVNKDIAGGEITVNYITAFKICHSITRITAIKQHYTTEKYNKYTATATNKIVHSIA